MGRFSAAVLGASGQVGQSLVQSLLAEPNCTTILLLNRRQLAQFSEEPRITQHVVEMDKIATEAV